MADPVRVLVLGSGGFIGRHAFAAFEGSSEVVALPGAGPEARRSSGDLLTADLDSMLASARPGVVVNCAGRTEGSEAGLTAANVTLVARLLESLVRLPNTRLVHIGSAAEYGPGVTASTRESAPERPLAAYGKSKLAATNLIRAAPLQAVVLRVFNPLGAGMAPSSMPGRARDLIRSALASGGRSIMMGSLAAERDFVDVRDVAEAVVAAATVDEPPPVVNIGSGRATRAREVVSLLAAVAGFDGEIDEVAEGSPRSVQVDRQVADIGVARDRLDWTPRRSLRDSVTALWTGG
jgi:nucleoside-diphosphate-sugar epimerase